MHGPCVRTHVVHGPDYGLTDFWADKAHSALCCRWGGSLTTSPSVKMMQYCSLRATPVGV